MTTHIFVHYIGQTIHRFAFLDALMTLMRHNQWARIVKKLYSQSESREMRLAVAVRLLTET